MWTHPYTSAWAIEVTVFWGLLHIGSYGYVFYSNRSIFQPSAGLEQRRTWPKPQWAASSSQKQLMEEPNHAGRRRITGEPAKNPASLSRKIVAHASPARRCWPRGRRWLLASRQCPWAPRVKGDHTRESPRVGSRGTARLYNITRKRKGDCQPIIGLRHFSAK